MGGNRCAIRFDQEDLGGGHKFMIYLLVDDECLGIRKNTMRNIFISHYIADGINRRKTGR